MMKNVLFTIHFMLLSLLILAQSNPTPFNLNTGNYSLTEWSASSTAGTYPNNMIFRTTSSNAPGLATLATGDWVCLYDIESRSRVNGLGTDGISIIITGNTQDDGLRCVGDETSTTTSEHPFETILALNALNREQITVSYTHSVLVRNFRDFAIRLQYRLGQDGAWVNIGNNETSEYVVNTVDFPENVDQNFTVVLPIEANNQPLVQVRWVYYQLAGSPGGARPQIRLDNVLVSSEPFTGAAITEYFLKSTGAVNVLASWGTNPDGSGDAPTNFQAPNQRFVITNQTNAQLSGNWFVTGANSRIQLGDGETPSSLTIPLIFEIEGFMEVENQASLTIEGFDFPTLVSAEIGSTVHFKQTLGTITIPNIPYGTLILENGTKNLGSGTYSVQNFTLRNTTLTVAIDRPTVQISGNLTLENTVNFGGEERFNHQAVGNGNQQYNFNGNLLEVFNFNGNKSNGNFTMAPNSNVSAVNNFNFTIGGSATFNDGGNTITLGDDLNLAGIAENYTFSGTIVMTGANGATNDLDGGNSNFSPVATINNLILNTPAENNIRLRPNAGGDTLKIAGNLTIMNQSTLNFNANRVNVGGNLSIGSDLNLNMGANGTLVFNGSSQQQFTVSNDTDVLISNLALEKPNQSSVISLDLNVIVSESLNLQGGLLNTNSLTLANLSVLESYTQQSLFVGNTFTQVLTQSGAVTLEAPLGVLQGDNSLSNRVTTLAFTNPDDAAVTSYTFTVVDDIAGNFSTLNEVTFALTGVEVTKTGSTTPIANTVVTTNVNENEVSDPAALRIGSVLGNIWNNVGEVQSTENGIITLTSTPLPSETGIFGVVSVEPVSVLELSPRNEVGLKAFPNPTNGVLYFNDLVTLQVFDITGKLITDAARVQQIDLSNFPNGLYFIRTLDGTTVKIVKQ